MKKGIIIFLSVFVFIHLNAQDITPKKNTLTKVFNDLVNAYGSPKSPPKLELLSSKKHDTVIAQYYPTPTPIVKVDEMLFDLCMQMGIDSLNALSIILSHELAHYYYDHAWYRDFAFAVRNQITISKEDIVTHESEADEFGLYHSCIAGYHPFNIYGSLLGKIYKAYSLPNNLKGYPSLDDRKKISDDAQVRITKLYNEFTTGKAAIVSGNYDTAIKCFQDLNTHFPSRENYNNLGTARTLWAIKLKALEKIEVDNPDFFYPIVTDVKSRLENNMDRSQDEEAAQKMNELLISAERDFEKAISLDPDYDIAHINLACVFDLLDNPEAAIGEIKKMPIKMQNQEKAYRILGIAYYHNDNERKSKEMFDKTRSFRQ